MPVWAQLWAQLWRLHSRTKPTRPALRRLTAARAKCRRISRGHRGRCQKTEGQSGVPSKHLMHNKICTAIYAQHRAKATQAGSDKETPISKTTISDIEFQKFDVASPISKEHSSILKNLRYRKIQTSKLKTSIPNFLRYRTASISKPRGFDIKVSQNSDFRYRSHKTSISKFYDLVQSYPISKSIFRTSISKFRYRIFGKVPGPGAGRPTRSPCGRR
jgi:hypothetical protein